MMPVRDDIVRGAIWEAYEGSWKPTALEMTAYFESAGLAPPSPSELKKFASAPSNIVINSQSIAWCGIFACSGLKHFGGLDVHWVYGKGIRGSGVQLFEDYRYMQIGDVAVIRKKARSDGNFLHHHYIITAIDYDGNSHSFVEGNGESNKIHYRKDYPIGQETKSQNFLKRPYAYYRVSA
jgi:hypothetical protein